MGTVSFLSLQTCTNRTQPIFVDFFFVRYQLNSCCAMEVNHRVLGPAVMLVASSHHWLTFDGLLLFSRLISRCLRCPTTSSLMLRPNEAKNSSSRMSIALSMDKPPRAEPI